MQQRRRVTIGEQGVLGDGMAHGLHGSHGRERMGVSRVTRTSHRYSAASLVSRVKIKPTSVSTAAAVR